MPLYKTATARSPVESWNATGNGRKETKDGNWQRKDMLTKMQKDQVEALYLDKMNLHWIRTTACGLMVSIQEKGKKYRNSLQNEGLSAIIVSGV